MLKKQNECNCLEMTKQYVEKYMNNKSCRYFKSLFPLNYPVIQSERPDFIVNTETSSYAVEHFLIDFCYDGPQNNQSQSRRAQRSIQDIYTKYHDPSIGTIKDCDIEEALHDIENEVNKIVNLSQSFNYEKFIDRFNKVFQDHYKRLPNYRANSEIMQENVNTGFLIDFHRDTLSINALLNGVVVSFMGGTKEFPITHDILHIFEDAKELDFIILSQFNEGAATEASSVSIFEPNNMKKSIEIQNIKVYDKVFFTKLKKELKLNIEDGKT
jgi:hypothetical protein